MGMSRRNCPWMHGRTRKPRCRRATKMVNFRKCWLTRMQHAPHETLSAQRRAISAIGASFTWPVCGRRCSAENHRSRASVTFLQHGRSLSNLVRVGSRLLVAGRLDRRSNHARKRQVGERRWNTSVSTRLAPAVGPYTSGGLVPQTEVARSSSWLCHRVSHGPNQG
jgi:hypothetical protein